MYLMRVGPAGQERPAVRVDEHSYVDVSDLTVDFDEAFLAAGGARQLADEVRARRSAGHLRDVSEQRIGAPIARPYQIVCIGLNYADHAAETNQPVPAEPIVFNKAPNTLAGPYDDVLIPRGSDRPDWEVELGIVIGRRSRYLDSELDAREAIAGYVVVNDVSERSFQLDRGGQWVKGKSAETFNPCGPYLVTPDEIDDVSNLNLWLDVNADSRQRGNTATMIFGPYFLVHYLSQFMVLEPGDLINTGTPPGVGMGFTPPVWLKPGDVIQLGIDKLGAQRQRVRAAP